MRSFMQGSKSGKLKRQGSVLILALWSLCFLVVLSVYLGLGVRQKARLAYQLDARDSVHFIAEAGAKRALIEFIEEDDSPGYDALREQWSNNPERYERIAVGPGYFTVGYPYTESGLVKMRYGLRDEESKINLNTAEPVAIERLLRTVVGLGKSEAIELAYAIVDWRDKDSFYGHPQYGAEDSDYRNSTTPYECKDALFDVPEELLLVDGMTGQIFDMIKAYITVYGEGAVNINTAPREVLSAVGFEDDLINKIVRYRSGEDELEGTEDDNIFTSASSIVPQLSQLYRLSPSEVAKLSNVVSANSLGTQSHNFMVISAAELTTGKEAGAVIAVFDREGAIKYWREQFF